MALARLIIHMDVNETMIVSDPAGGDSFEDCLNKVVCKQAIVRRNGNGFTWADGRPLATDGPPPELHYWDVPEGCSRFYEQPELKKKYAKTFCEDLAVYKGLHSELEAALRTDETDPRLVRGAHHFVLPAVWALLESLKGSRFTLVLRTFGSDLEAVAAALDAFAERTGEDSLRVTEFYKLRRRGDSCVATPLDGGDDIDEAALIDLIERDDQAVRCIGISDDYASWRAAGYDPAAGKPLWITPKARHVFFDDNIHNNPNDSIVSARYVARDGRILPLDGRLICALQNIALVRVPTLEPILHHDWFRRKLDECLDNMHHFESLAPARDDYDLPATAWFEPWLASTGLSFSPEEDGPTS